MQVTPPVCGGIDVHKDTLTACLGYLRNTCNFSHRTSSYDGWRILARKRVAGKQGNWLRTVPGKGYFAILRLYSPTEAAITKSWKPSDIEKVNEVVKWRGCVAVALRNLFHAQ